MIKLQVKVTFEKFISQVFNSMRPRLLDLVKRELELSLDLLRDKLIDAWRGLYHCRSKAVELGTSRTMCFASVEFLAAIWDRDTLEALFRR